MLKSIVAKTLQAYIQKFHILFKGASKKSFLEKFLHNLPLCIRQYSLILCFYLSLYRVLFILLFVSLY
jgi:hypothetical protein